MKIVSSFSRNNPKSKQSAKYLCRLIADAAYNKSKQPNVRTPFNLKKAKAISDYKSKLNSLQQRRASTYAPSSSHCDLNEGDQKTSELNEYLKAV